MIALKRVKLEGFRGAKKPLELSFSNPVVMTGHSGSGKTSILQAIEWAFFGVVSGFKGYGFTDEDAYVNMFSDELKAVVELDLMLTDERSLFIKRSRKKARKSTVGTTNVEVWFKGEKHKGKEAQNLIEALLDLDHDRFTQAIFLHQDMIRKFVEGGPKDRSEIIDQLLGLRNLRDFTESLDPKRKIQKEIKILQGIKQGLEKQKKAIEIDRQQRLNQQEEALKKNGFKETELTFDYLNDLVDSLITQLGVLSKKYNLEPLAGKLIITNYRTAKIIQKQIASSIIAVDRARSNQISKYETQKIRIQEALKQLDQGRTKIENKSIEKLTKNTLELEQEINTQESQKEEYYKKVGYIGPLLSEYAHLSSLLNEKKAKSQKILADYGDYNDLNLRKERNIEEIERLEFEIKKEDSLTNILTSAYSYISETESKDCPICKQEIDPETVLKELEAQNKTTGERLTSNKKKIEELQKKNKEILSVLHSWEMIQGEIDSLNKQIAEKRQKLSSITSVKDITLEAARSHFEKVNKKLRALEIEIQEKKLKKRQNEQEIVELEDATKLVKRMEDTLRDLIPNLDSREARSLDKSTSLFLETIDAKIKELQVTVPIDSLREKAERIEPIVSYLVKMEDFKQRAGEESNIDKELDEISYKILKLEDFETSLQYIREIVCGHQNELTQKSLEEFQSSINYYYGKIIGHPFFKKLKIEPIAGEPVAYDLLAYGEEAEFDTHVNTRFSTAQANCVALALFFAINRKLAANFPLLILDDPTQNMDQTFQGTLVETLCSLAENRQLLIATHEEQFGNKLVEKLKPAVDLIRMNQWTIEGLNPIRSSL